MRVCERDRESPLSHFNSMKDDHPFPVHLAFEKTNSRTGQIILFYFIFTSGGNASSRNGWSFYIELEYENDTPPLF